MPFEVFPVEAPNVHHEISSSGRSPEDVASEIAGIYTRVAEKGGKIIAQHTLSRFGDTSTGDMNWLFLVAETPDESTK